MYYVICNMYYVLYIIYNEEGPNSNELGPFRTACIEHSILF